MTLVGNISSSPAPMSTLTQKNGKCKISLQLNHVQGRLSSLKNGMVVIMHFFSYFSISLQSSTSEYITKLGNAVVMSLYKNNENKSKSHEM
jgi:hypothetical protein